MTHAGPDLQIWPTIIDPNQLATSGLQVHNSDQGAERRPWMGRSRANMS